MSFDKIYDEFKSKASLESDVSSADKFAFVDAYFAGVYNHINELEYKNVKEYQHPLCQAANLPKEDVYVHVQYQDLATRHGLALIKRGISYAHGAAIVAMASIKNIEDTNACINRIFERTARYIAEVENARQSDKLGNKKGLIAFEDDQFQKFLHDLTKELTASTKIDYKKAHHQLIEAERLACWQHRPTVVTFSQSTDDFPILMVDKPVAKITTKLMQQFQQIPEKYAAAVKNDEEETKKDKTWYDLLSPVQQQWLVAHRTAILNNELGCPPAILRNVPSAANFTEHQIFFQLPDGRIVSRTEYRHSITSPIDIDEDEAIRNEIAQDNAEEILKVTDVKQHFNSFWGDSPFKKHFHPIHLEQSLLSPLGKLDENIRYAENNLQMARDNQAAFIKAGEKLGIIDILQPKQPSEPTAAQTLNNSDQAKLIVTNWAINAERGASDPFEDKRVEEKLQNVHYSQITDDQKQVKLAVEDITHNKQKTLALLNEVKNVYTVIKDGLVDLKFIGSLVNSHEDFLSFFNSDITNFSINCNAQLEQAESLFQLINSNQYARQELAQYLFNANDPIAEEKAIKFASALVASVQYYQLWHLRETHAGFNGNNRRLFAAGYEAIIVEGLGGIVTSTCKSTKDRNANKNMHNNAMMQNLLKLNRLPDYYDKGLKRLYYIVSYSRQFISGHFQFLANLNSRGVEGCKDGKSKFNILPKLLNHPMIPLDVQKGVEAESKRSFGTKDYLECQDALAKLNKPKLADNPYAPQSKVKKTLLSIAEFLLIASVVIGLCTLGPLAAIPVVFLTHLLSGSVGLGLLSQTFGSPDSKKPTLLFLGGMAAALALGVGLSYITGGILPLLVLTVVAGIAASKIIRDFMLPAFRNWWYADKTVEFKEINVDQLNTLFKNNSEEVMTNQLKAEDSNDNSQNQNQVMEMEDITAYDTEYTEIYSSEKSSSESTRVQSNSTDQSNTNSYQH